MVAGSEDGSVHWFDAERGDLMAVLSFGGAGRPVTAVAFHPTDHALAVCSLNAAESVVLLEFDKNDTQVVQAMPRFSGRLGALSWVLFEFDCLSKLGLR